MSINEKKYLIVGDGRLAKHLSFYFSTIGLTFEKWARSNKICKLEDALGDTNTVLLAISDGAITCFVKDHLPLLQGKAVIHFSGALAIDGVIGCHPLMTFPPQLYAEDFYHDILFCIDDDAPDFRDLFPRLNNPYIAIAKEKKARYHTLCVMANNFTCLLWQKFYKEMIDDFGADKKSLDPFLRRTTENIIHNYKTCLTGPLVRKDSETIKKNLLSLENDSFQQVYQSFVKMYEETGLEIQ